MQGIYIGTSGWSYRHWKGLFYPPKLKSTDWIIYYAQYFSVSEINASFYRLPTAQTVLNWAGRVPPGFMFCPKMSRYLTHMKKLLAPEETLEKFFEVFSLMRDMMGPVLIQLPPFLTFSYDRAEHLYAVLKKNYGAYSFVMEVRHESWFREESLTLMAKYDIGLVISQSGNEFPYLEMVTAKNIYIRFHGPKELYASSYEDATLEYFARKMKEWVKEGHEVWAFFNNDIHGYAVEDAKRLKKMVEN